LAEYHRNQRHDAEAERLFREVMDAHTRTLAPEHPFRLETQSGMAILYRLQARYREADELFQQVLAARRNSLDPNHPDLANALFELGLTLLACGKAEQASPLASECLRIREKISPDDWQTFAARSLLGSCLVELGQTEPAEPLLLNGYEGLKKHELKLPAFERARLRESLQALVRLYQT